MHRLSGASVSVRLERDEKELERRNEDIEGMTESNSRDILSVIRL